MAGARVDHVAELDVFLARAVQHRLLHRRRQGFERGLDVKAVMPSQAFQQRKVVAVAPVPALDGAAGQAQRGKGHHPRRVKKLLHAQTITGRAGALRRVERKQAWLQLADRVAAHRAGELGVEHVLNGALSSVVVGLGAVGFDSNRAPAADSQRCFKTLGQALLQVGAHLDPVNHHVQIVFFGFLERRQFVEFKSLAVDPKAHIALRLQAGDQVLKLAFFAPRQGRQNHQSRV